MNSLRHIRFRKEYTQIVMTVLFVVVFRRHSTTQGQDHNEHDKAMRFLNHYESAYNFVGSDSEPTLLTTGQEFP